MEKVVNSKQMKGAKEALISDQESTLELQSQIEALRYHLYITSANEPGGWVQNMAFFVDILYCIYADIVCESEKVKNVLV